MIRFSKNLEFHDLQIFLLKNSKILIVFWKFKMGGKIEKRRLQFELEIEKWLFVNLTSENNQNHRNFLFPKFSSKLWEYFSENFSRISGFFNEISKFWCTDWVTRDRKGFRSVDILSLVTQSVFFLFSIIFGPKTSVKNENTVQLTSHATHYDFYAIVLSERIIQVGKHCEVRWLKIK